MASDYVVPSQAFRVFMEQEICQHLTPSDVESLLYTNRLPMPDLTESSRKVLMKLEMRDIFSASKITPLADMMRNIQRNDLAKKVEKFQKLKSKKEHKKKDKERCAVDARMLQKCQITASITTIKLQTKILLEQIEELKSTSSKMGYTEVEKVIRDAVAIIEVQFQEKLQLASSKLPQLRQESCDSLDSPPSSLCSSEDVLDVRSPMGTLERGSKTRSLPRSKCFGTIDYELIVKLLFYTDFTPALKKPLLPPSTSTQAQDLYDDHDYEYVTAGSLSPPLSQHLHYSSTDIAPSSIQDGSRGHLVTGRDSPAQPSKLKPVVAPKPSKLKQNSTTSTSDYTGGSADTSTADSGFVDSEKFRKECPPRLLPRHNYTPLKAELRETVGCYATPEPQGKHT